MYFPCVCVCANSLDASEEKNGGTMLLILDGNSEIGTHVTSNLCYLACLKYLIRSRAATKRIFFSEKTYFLYARATCFELPSNISTMGGTSVGRVSD